MPKDKRLNSLSLDRAMASPYSRGSNSADPEIDIMDEEKQWDDTLCPICMDHPHNAVLLLCSSRQTGCRAFVCDTSYRHSNCLDQLLRSNGTRPLACPLCRGSVSGWEVVGPARDLMNSKTRSCSLETCEFSGTYADLRKHARAEHPLGRPFEASPSRQAGWTELERRLDMEDALVYQSHMDFEEPELWDEWGTDGLFDLPGGISDIEDGLLEEIFGGGLSSYTSSSYTSFSYTDEEDVDSDSSVSRLDSEENGMSRSRSHREADVSSRSGYHRGSSSSARRESYSRQNENLTTSGAGYARGNVRSSYRGEHRQQQPSSRGGSGVDRVRSGLHVRSDGRSSSSSSRRHLSGSSQHFSGSSRQHLSGSSSSSSRRHLSGGSSSSSRRHLSGSSRQQSRGE